MLMLRSVLPMLLSPNGPTTVLIPPTFSNLRLVRAEAAAVGPSGRANVGLW